MDQDYQKKAVRRLKIIEGQVRGLREMVARGDYCIDIITQADAVKAAIAGVEDLVLENHLSTHVVHQVKSGSGNKAIAEIIKVYKAQRHR